MSENKLSGIKAATKEIIGLAWSANLGNGKFEESIEAIIAKHCYGKDEFLGSNGAEANVWAEERSKLLAACKEYRERIDRLENSLEYSRHLNNDFCRIAHQFEEPISKNEACE